MCTPETNTTLKINHTSVKSCLLQKLKKKEFQTRGP